MSPDIPTRVLHLEHSVSDVRETIAQLTAEQRHLTKTMDRVDKRTEVICESLSDLPSFSRVLKDPRALFLIFILFSGAVGADTAAAGFLRALAPVEAVVP